MKTLAIIGGGAAGLAAAVTAALALKKAVPSEADRPHIVIYEADERVGRSILVTGNGRCNFSNAHIDPQIYRNAAFVGEALAALEQAVADAGIIPSPENAPANAVQSFFAMLGLVWREEAEGRLYPWTNKASSVLDILRFAAADLGVEVAGEYPVLDVEAPREPGKPFTMHLKGMLFRRADAVIVASGGATPRDMLPDGFAYIDPVPTLGSLATDNKTTRRLDKIRVRATVSLQRPRGGGGAEEIAREAGELMFRTYGVSGIAVFNLSRFAKAGDALVIDLLPYVGESDVQTFAQNRCRSLSPISEDPLNCGRFLRGLLTTPVADAMLEAARLSEDKLCDADTGARLIRLLKHVTLEVRGIGDASICQVRRGGFAVDGFSPTTMEARALPGCFVVGEALDVDAPCGGFNLHWAWASGMLAGLHAAKRLQRGLVAGQPFGKPASW